MFLTDTNIMRVTVVKEANNFIQFLRLCHDDNKDSWVYQEHFKISKCNNEPLLSMIEGNQPVFICEKMPPPVCESENTESSDEISFIEETPVKPPELNTGPLPLSVSKAREILSWYTMSQNPYMSQVDSEVLHPLWVRCDKQDPANTSWLGAEPVYTGDKVTAVKLYTVSCKGSSADEASFITIDQLKQEHQKRHHTTTVLTKGWAMYNLFCSVKEESLVIDSESSVTAYFKWNNVEKTLEIPPLSSTVTLHIKVTAGDIRSPMYQTYRELEFLLTLAEGLRTEEIQWLEPLETRSAVDLSRALIEELENIANAVPGQNLKGSEKSRNDSVVGLGCMLTERGDLDFTEQLWEKMRRSVTSYQDITDSLKLVIKAVRLGRIKPWVHRDSSSSLSKLIVQSYQQQVDMVPLTGLTPAIMLLELGLDKMRKDYINYLVGNELTTLNHLSYYLSSEVNLQEQVIRLRKLHHLMEVLGTCSSFLNLPHERLFLFTQSCLQYYKTAPYNEEHVFEMQIKPALISYFYQTEQPSSWGVEVSSGQGSREVKTSWHLSDKPLVDHINYDSDAPLEVTVNGESEKIAFFRTMVCCSLANFS